MEKYCCFNKKIYVSKGDVIMTEYERQYMQIAKEIRNEGIVEINKRTGIGTGRIPHAVMTLDLQEDVPLLQGKTVAWKTAVREILWIMQKASNNINDLKGHVWDEWADEDGSIGKAYGYQIAKYDQVRNVLDRLSKDPSDRRAVIDMWQCKDIPEMNLTPCCYSSIYSVIDGKLNCMLIQRSGDWMLGVPFNTFQYAILTMMFARHLGLKPGILTHCIADAHIYTTHAEGLDEYLFNCYNNVEKLEAPTLKFKDDAPTNFYKMSEEDLEVGYTSCGKISFEVAV
jgi:thymidylate synthase